MNGFGALNVLGFVYALPLLYALVMPLRYIYGIQHQSTIEPPKIPSPFCFHCGESAGNSQEHLFHLRAFVDIYWPKNQYCQLLQVF